MSNFELWSQLVKNILNSDCKIPQKQLESVFNLIAYCEHELDAKDRRLKRAEAVINVARRFVPDERIIQTERRERELKDALASYDSLNKEDGGVAR